ncbi:hypothetical protein LTR95_005533 [Oleoguttula sp. CCFEE 5521]
MSAMFTKLAVMALAASVAQAAPWQSDSATASSAASSTTSMMAESSAATSAVSYSTAMGSGVSTVQDPAPTTTAGGDIAVGTGFPTFLDPIPTDVAASLKKLAKDVNADVTQVDRFTNLLSDDGKTPLTGQALQDRLVFDFKRAPKGGNGGRILVANENNFPLLVGNGIAGAVGFLEPCGMNSPHTHPRATEMLTVVEGEIETGFVLENGLFGDAAKATFGNGTLAFPFNATLNQFQSTIFPQGSIHFQFNNQCKDAIFVAALNSADPVTSQIAQNFFTLDDRIVDITLGDVNQITPSNLKQFRGNLPANLVKAADECIARCY